MTSEIRLAFENLEARAAADPAAQPFDRISLRDHIVAVEIGAFQAERGTTQRICFNVVVEVRPPHKPLRDDVDRILSYDTITEAISFELAAERLNLLETLADRVAERILLAEQAERVFVRIEKLDRGSGALGVEIVREKTSGDLQSPDDGEDPAPHPLIVHLSNAAIGSANLSGWLDQLEATGRPVIFSVETADLAAPVSASGAAQRRIELLAIEQNAWVLAGQDKRCVVMRSRTELDWAARNEQMSVWAPSKIVLDSRDVPTSDTAGELALVSWFCGAIGGSELIVIGARAPDGLQIPTRSVPVDQADLQVAHDSQ
ncbi:MAG: dihydroneopterin aldolase [Marinosulfonomonas sp.]|nr:dihydroneopterin aldolase [Marinosulfonomonas sp.]